MTAHLLAWNPNKFHWSELPGHLEALDRGDEPDFPWSVGHTKKIGIGDRVFLIRLGVEPRGIVGSGIVVAPVYEDDHWDRTDGVKSARFVKARWDVLAREPIVSYEDLQEAPFSEVHWSIRGSGVSLPDHVAEALGRRLEVEDQRKGSWKLRPGDLIERKRLHREYGGNGQSGISPSSSTSNVMIFSDPSSGEQHGYFDRWDGDRLIYTGEGQRGDQTMSGGNRAILDHVEDGRRLRVFNGSKGVVRYVGEYQLGEPAWQYGYAPETDGGPVRRVLQFNLRPVGRERTVISKMRDRVYVTANETPSSTIGDPFSRDPNEVDRALAAHAKVQNGLHEVLDQNRIKSWSPEGDEPDYDLAWVRGKTYFVAEVKSLSEKNEAKQLRLGLGQVLDYQDALRGSHPTVRAILAVERAPTDSRWVGLCERHGVTLVWPEILSSLLRSKLA